MYQRGRRILNFEGYDDFQELERVIQWDVDYERERIEQILVPDFYFLLLYGKCNSHDVYAPFVTYLFDCAVNRFVLLEENYGEMLRYFVHGRELGRHINDAGLELAATLRGNSDVKRVLALWDAYVMAVRGAARGSFSAVVELLSAYRDLVQRMNHEQSGELATLRTVMRFDQDYVRPLNRIKTLISNPRIFIPRSGSTFNIYPEADERVRKVALRALETLRPERHGANEIDAIIQAKCRSWTAHCLERSGPVLCHMTDGAAYVAAKRASKRKEDWLARNLRCRTVYSARRDASGAISEPAQAIANALPLIGRGGVLAREGEGGTPEQGDAVGRMRALDELKRSIQLLFERIDARGSDCSGDAWGTSMFYWFDDYDDPAYDPEQSHLSGVTSLVKNIDRYSQGIMGEYDVDRILEEIERKILWVKDENSWQLKRAELLAKVQGYRPETLQAEASALAAEAEIRERMIGMCSGNRLVDREAIANCVRSVLALDVAVRREIVGELERAEELAVKERRYQAAQVAHSLQEGIAGRDDEH